MTPHESHLQSDGSVFPPVTPDPPTPPGLPEIDVPDIVPVRTPDGPDSSADTRRTADTPGPAAGDGVSAPETDAPD